MRQPHPRSLAFATKEIQIRCGLALLAIFLTAVFIPGCGGGSNTYNPALISGTPAAASFRVAVAPPSVTVTAGQAATYTVTVTAVNAFSGAVNLSVGGLPAGATGTFSPASVTPTAGGVTSTLTVTTTGAAAGSRTSTSRSVRTKAAIGPRSPAADPGITTTFTVTGASDNLTSSGTADIVVVPAEMSFFMITAGGTQTVRAGESASYNFTVTSVNGFAGAVTFSATNLPTGATASFSPTSVTLTANESASGALTIQTAANTPVGTTMPTIVGTSGALTNQAAETLVVTAVASTGSHIFVADATNNRIVRMNDITGAGWTTFGSLGSGIGQFQGPTGLFVAPDNRIYIADSNNNRIVRIDDFTGAGWTSFGTEGSGVNQFLSPYDIRVDSQNRIYVADRDNARVVRFNDMTGAGWVTFGEPGTGTGQFGLINGLFVDSANRIYIPDNANNRIVRIDDMTGANLTTLGGGLIHHPQAVFVDGSNRIYSSDVQLSNSDPTDRVVRVDDISGANPTFYPVDGPEKLFVDTMGKIYIPSSTDDRIIRIDDMTGAGLVSLGTHGSGTNQFRLPYEVFVR